MHPAPGQGWAATFTASFRTSAARPVMAGLGSQMTRRWSGQQAVSTAAAVLVSAICRAYQAVAVGAGCPWGEESREAGRGIAKRAIMVAVAQKQHDGE
jgi:hypothetical protein